MRITEEAVDAFIGLYREEFGAEIGRSEAREIAFQLVTLYEALATRLPNDADHPLPTEKFHRPIGFRV